MENPAAIRARRKKAVRHAVSKFIALSQAVQQYRKGNAIDTLADEFAEAVIEAVEALEQPLITVR